MTEIWGGHSHVSSYIYKSDVHEKNRCFKKVISIKINNVEFIFKAHKLKKIIFKSIDMTPSES